MLQIDQKSLTRVYNTNCINKSQLLPTVIINSSGRNESLYSISFTFNNIQCEFYFFRAVFQAKLSLRGSTLTLKTAPFFRRINGNFPDLWCTVQRWEKLLSNRILDQVFGDPIYCIVAEKLGLALWSLSGNTLKWAIKTNAENLASDKARYLLATTLFNPL